MDQACKYQKRRPKIRRRFSQASVRKSYIIYSIRLTIFIVQIEFAFSHASIEKLPVISDLILQAIRTSEQYTNERGGQEPRTDCVSMFVRPGLQDSSIVIIIGSRAYYALRDALDLTDLELQ
jgi:hypothetical protein